MTPTSKTLLRATGLCFSYPGKTVLQDFSIEIPAGVTLIQGGDGSGKSSLLRLLAGATAAAAGTLAIGAADLATQPEAYRRKVFWMEPRSEAFDQITARAWFDTLPSYYPQFDASVLADVVTGLSLQTHLDKQLFMLSTGSKRKVWLAGMFAAGAAINLLDDPLAGLDRASINFFFDTLRLAACNTARAFVLAMYEAPAGVPLASTVELEP